MEENRKKTRLTQQYLLPLKKPHDRPEGYNIYPSHPLNDEEIFCDNEKLAQEILNHRMVKVDGYQGVFFEDFRAEMDSVLRALNVQPRWISTQEMLKSAEEIDLMIQPFLGGDDPLFGSRATISLEDFFDESLLKSVVINPNDRLTIIYGPGASLASADGFLVYIDIPKNEIQFRARAQSISNLGAVSPYDAKAMYKRFYFVDWVVLNHHKQKIWSKIQIIIDGQRPGHWVWAKGYTIRNGLRTMSHNAFRVRPWFEPGVWGGEWIKGKIDGLNKNVANYAWSFELIVPENGLIFESSGLFLEISFDSIMFQEAKAVLGQAWERFGTEFPIRFDFLDTFSGGNLSVQCHPYASYTKHEFNENFTQEETYYILDAGSDAEVYLGFQEDINPMEFQSALESSFAEAKPLDIEKYVQKHPAQKHDLFLIPPGTIHASGRNNLVLEISSTPYIFTFKLYDWVRPDLDGKPRPLNIDRGMRNLSFERKGDYVKQYLLSKPALIEQGKNWQIFHLPTHENHLYDVHRIHFSDYLEIETHNKCHVLSLVEGAKITLVTENGLTIKMKYAETHVIPAAANSYRLFNLTNAEAMVIKAFVK